MSYIKLKDKNRYSIGKYASEHENATALHNCRKRFSNIKESTVRKFKKRYEKQLQKAKKKNLQPPKSTEKYLSKTGLPLVSGKLDSMIQNYIERMSNWRAAITWSIANAATKALIGKYPGVISGIDVDSSCWLEVLFCRI